MRASTCLEEAEVGGHVAGAICVLDDVDAAGGAGDGSGWLAWLHECVGHSAEVQSHCVVHACHKRRAGLRLRGCAVSAAAAGMLVLMCNSACATQQTAQAARSNWPAGAACMLQLPTSNVDAARAG